MSNTSDRTRKPRNGDLDRDGDRDLDVNGPLDKHGKECVAALESLCASEPGFLPKLEQVAGRLGTKTEWLVNVMMMESSLDPARKNPNSTATGLIQFMAKTAAKLGTSCAALRRMSAVKQLDWVERYFHPFSGKLSSQAAVYSAVGAGKVSDSDTTVMFRAGTKEYRANKVWDVNRDGRITQGEMGRVAQRFGAGEQFDLDGGGSPGVAEPTEETTEKPADKQPGNGETEAKPETLAGAPVKAGHIIADTVGAGGKNHAGDVAAVQTALAAHGQSPGPIDHQLGPATLRAIRRFQRGFMKSPDGLVEVGKTTEHHLVSGSPPRVAESEREEPEEERERPQPRRESEPDEERETRGEQESETSSKASAQMARLVGEANDVASKRPGGACYHAVKHHIIDAGGYGNIRNIYSDPRFSGAQALAHQFADRVNQNPAKFGLERLSISNPYDAPTGAIVVVAAGSPGTHHPTAGDIAVKGPGDVFYNDGRMGYHGRSAWPPRRGGVLGVYKPR